MIEDVNTGRLIATEVRPIEADDLRRLAPGWRFDWLAEAGGMEVFKLIDPVTPDAILGLVALRRCSNYVEVSLLECSPRNVGRTKGFRGIAGSLFAFAAQLSIDLGGKGFISMIAKSNLLEHYHRTYGFERIRNSQGMILGPEAAAMLIATYGGRPAHE